MSEAAWHPDPSGRNQYRWWDGAAWSDHVSNNGVVGVDPAQPSSPTTAVVPDVVAQSPSATIISSSVPELPGRTAGSAPFGGVPQTSGTPFSTNLEAATARSATVKRSSPLKWIIPVVLVLAVGAVLFLVLGGGDDDGGSSFGAVEGELEADDSIVTFNYELSAGDTIRFRVEPESGFDAVGIVVIDRATSREYGDAAIELFSDDGFTDTDDFFSDTGDLFSDADLGEFRRSVVLTSADDGFEGEPESDFVTAFADGTYTVAVASYASESRGTFRLIVEKFDERIDLGDLDGLDAFDEYIDDNDDFFSDEDFFSNEDEFDAG